VQALWFQTALLAEGWSERVRLTLEEGRIACVERADPQPGDERHAIGLPGLCNLHSHGFQRAMAGLTGRPSGNADDFWSWRSLMYRFLERIEPEDVQAITALAYCEMLESGFTRVGEFHYLHHRPDGRPYDDPSEMGRQVIEAASESGIGLSLLPVFYAHSGFGGAEPEPAQRRFLSTPDGFADLVERLRSDLPGDMIVGIAPHSLRAVTPDELRRILPLAEGWPIHIHAAEQQREVEACLAWSGARPVEWLLDNAGVDERWCLVHATHMTQDECGRLARSGAIAGLCPITEADLGDGVFAGPDYLAAGGRFGIGSDSNVRIDAADELRLLEYGQRLARRGRNLMSGGGGSVGGSLFRHAAKGGAQALAAPGAITVGDPADLVSLKMDHPALAARGGDDLLDGWIFAAGREAVDCVWRGGRRLVSGGRHSSRETFVDRYRQSLERLLA
jgi:formiminoglutamate deiminase